MIEPDFHQQALRFLDQLDHQLTQHGLVLAEHWDIDHLCFRVSSEDSYQKFKSQFSNFATLLIESEVNGRMISTFKLQKPILFKKWSIDVVELPAPKKGKITVEGFEHVEIVSDLTFSEIQVRYPNLKYDRSGLAKDFNPELEIELEKCAIKFHPLSLESVVRLEAQTKIFHALKNSNVLQVFKNNSPLVAGTFPLGLSQENSDLDILVGMADLDLAEQELVKNFSKHDQFTVAKTLISNEPTVIANFVFEQVPFEIFIQKIPAAEQQAYRHFLIEEKLLKLGGRALFEKIKKLRKSGLKTEPAFAQVLKLSGDSYLELLKLQKSPYQHLQSLLNEHL